MSRRINLSPGQEAAIAAAIGFVLGAGLALFDVISTGGAVGVGIGAGLAGFFNAKRRAPRQQ